MARITGADAKVFAHKLKDACLKKGYVFFETGDYNLKFNMQNILEAFYIPVRGGDATTSIETTKGLDYSAIEDVT